MKKLTVRLTSRASYGKPIRRRYYVGPEMACGDRQVHDATSYRKGRRSVERILGEGGGIGSLPERLPYHEAAYEVTVVRPEILWGTPDEVEGQIERCILRAIEQEVA